MGTRVKSGPVGHGSSDMEEAEAACNYRSSSSRSSSIVIITVVVVVVVVVVIV